MERVTGIEPVTKAWEAAVIPFHHTRREDSRYTFLNRSSSCLFDKLQFTFKAVGNTRTRALQLDWLASDKRHHHNLGCAPLE